MVRCTQSCYLVWYGFYMFNMRAVYLLLVHLWIQWVSREKQTELLCFIHVLFLRIGKSQIIQTWTNQRGTDEGLFSFVLSYGEGQQGRKCSQVIKRPCSHAAVECMSHQTDSEEPWFIEHGARAAVWDHGPVVLPVSNLDTPGAKRQQSPERLFSPSITIN